MLPISLGDKNITDKIKQILVNTTGLAIDFCYHENTGGSRAAMTLSHDPKPSEQGPLDHQGE